VWVCEFGSKEPEKDDGTKGSPAPRDESHDKGRVAKEHAALDEVPSARGARVLQRIPAEPRQPTRLPLRLVQVLAEGGTRVFAGTPAAGEKGYSTRSSMNRLQKTGGA